MTFMSAFPLTTDIATSSAETLARDAAPSCHQKGASSEQNCNRCMSIIYSISTTPSEMNAQIIFANPKARPVRTTVSVLAVALEVVLIIIVAGLTEGMVTENGKRTAGMGAEINVQPPNSGIFLALSSNTMPVGLAPKLKKVSGVKAVAPIQLQINSGEGVETVFGIDPKSFYAVTGGFEFRMGRLFQTPDEVVVD